jgi:hypothetical protein
MIPPVVEKTVLFETSVSTLLDVSFRVPDKDAPAARGVVDDIVRDLDCGPCAFGQDSVGLHCACAATRAAAVITNVVDPIGVMAAIAGAAASDLNSATAARAAVGFYVVDSVAGDVHERVGYVQTEVVACRAGVGDLKTVEGNEAASQHDHRAIAGHRVRPY